VPWGWCLSAGCRTALRRFALLVSRDARGTCSPTGAVGGLAFGIVRIEARASGSLPATTPARSFRSACTLAIDVDHAGLIGSMLDTSWVIRLDGPPPLALSSTGSSHGLNLRPGCHSSLTDVGRLGRPPRGRRRPSTGTPGRRLAPVPGVAQSSRRRSCIAANSQVVSRLGV